MTGDRDDDDRELFRNAVGPVRRLREIAPPPTPAKPKPRARMAERDDAAARDEFRHVLDASPSTPFDCAQDRLRQAQDRPSPGQALLEAGDALAYRRDTLPPRVLQRLKRGEIAAQDELDLHGVDARTAETLLRGFLVEARLNGHACVRIIHGKGLHPSGCIGSSGAPVLKNLVDRLLRQRADVLAFHSAPAAQGGTGVVLVLLAPPQRRR